jgi:hypothetical protein
MSATDDDKAEVEGALSGDAAHSSSHQPITAREDDELFTELLGK